MKMVIGVDWSEEAFAAVQQALLLYRPAETTIVHGIDMGVFEYPAIAQLGSLQGYEGFRWAVTAAGEELLERTAMTVYSACSSVKRVNEIGNPAGIILRVAETEKADLVVIGARGRGRLAEAVLGSVSHRVLMHSPCTTLVVRGGSRPIKRVLAAAVEGKDDAGRIVKWLRDHPFKNSVEVCILSAVVPLNIDDPYLITQREAWSAAAKASAEDLVKGTAAELAPAYKVSTRVATGDPASIVAGQAEGMDLVVVSSHRRARLERLLLGSVSHAIVHRVSGPILIVH